MRILTLCVGNICRSPLAQALLARELQHPQHGLPGAQVASAGLGALVGHPADPLALQVAQAHGLDVSGHRAQQISALLCQQHQLILVMEQAHKTALEQQFPQVRGKVFRLGHASAPSGGFDIADPYRQPLPAFEAAYAAIAQGVAHWVPRIRQLA